MFERFDEMARWVIIRAREEAGRLRHDAVGAEHMLLALILIDDVSSRSRLRAFRHRGLKEIEHELARITRARERYMKAKAFKKLAPLREEEGRLFRRRHSLRSQAPRNVVTMLLQRLGVSIDTLHTDVGRALGVIPETQTFGEIPLTYEARRALELATTKEAGQLGHNRVTPTHLLLGLLKEGKSRASKAVASYGLDADSIRRELVALRQFLERGRRRSRRGHRGAR